MVQARIPAEARGLSIPQFRLVWLACSVLRLCKLGLVGRRQTSASSEA